MARAAMSVRQKQAEMGSDVITTMVRIDNIKASASSSYLHQ
jgi:hypothetical protein